MNSQTMKIRFADWKVVLAIAWPLIIANSFWNIQLTIDRMFLSHYSTLALGASVAVTSIFWTPMALVQQTAAYVTTFVAQYRGSGDSSKISTSVWNSIYAGTIGGLLFLCFIPFSDTLMNAMGHSPEMLKLESAYFASICFSALPTAYIATVSGLYTGIGRTKIIIAINGIGMLFNILFDYLLIFGKFGFPAFGIQGAGYATALANLVACAFGFGFLLLDKNKGDWSLATGWRWDSEFFLRYLKFGVPSGLQWALEGLSFAVFLVLLGQLPNGDIALPASSIAVTIMLIAILPSLGVGQAVSMLVGENLGKNQPDRAVSLTWAGFQMGLVYILLAGLSFVFFTEFYVSLFQAGDSTLIWQQTAALARHLLLFTTVVCLFDIFNFILGYALKGAGDTRFVFLAALVLPWPLMVLPTWLVRDNPDGVYWSWVGVCLFIFAQGMTLLWRFLGGKWKSMRVTDES